MKRSELDKLTRRELYEMAKAYDVEGRSKMAKDDLVEALSRVSARRVAPQPKEHKRRMAKRRVRHRKVQVRKSSPKTQPSVEATSPVKVVAPPPVEVRPSLFIDRGPELPHEYGTNKVVAMVRDPNWIYVYWDLSGGARERLSAQVVGGAWVLRVHNLSDGHIEDVPVLMEGGNWYLPVASDTQYSVDIGVLDMDGNFHLAASGRTVRTPPMGISELVDEEWLVLEDEFKQLMDLSGATEQRFAGSQFMSEIISRRRNVGGMHSAGVSSLASSRR